MKVIKFFPILLGGIGVIQAGMNRTIAETCGLSTATLINGVVVAICAALLFLPAYYFPNLFPDVVAFSGNKGFAWQWWYLLPGFIGFCLVFFVPLIIRQVGTLPVFLGMIAGQIAVSIFWDTFYENIPFTGLRITGALLTVAGALLAVWKR
jgi:uncharacterized membrane protein YdcZ (DUF606 family)